MEEEVDHDAHVQPQWYACQIMSRAEKKVARYLEDRSLESSSP